MIDAMSGQVSVRKDLMLDPDSKTNYAVSISYLSSFMVRLSCLQVFVINTVISQKIFHLG